MTHFAGSPWVILPLSVTSSSLIPDVSLQKVEHVKAVEVSLDTKLACVEVEAISLIDAMNMLPAMVDTIKVKWRRERDFHHGKY